MRRGGGAYNAVRQRGRSRAVESKASGADIYMKCVGWKCRFKSVLVLGIVLLAVVPLFAQQTPTPAATRTSTIPLTLAASLATPEPATSVNEKLAQLDQRVTEAKSSADNAWMLVSAALVLMMTGPGLALFYGGLVRRKNTLAIMMQSFALMALITVMWALVGYSLCFGGNGSVVGGFEHAFLRGVGAEPNPDYAGTIPQMTFMVYQLMFAVITPALITGATAERMKFSGTVLFMVGWFGFNAGSALAAGSLASSAFVATHFGAAAAALAWSAAEWIKNGRASALGAISGAVAGLVAITPAAGFVAPMPALAIGLIAGAVCYWMVTKVKAMFGYDDALDAFGVHGAGGTIGALLTGVFAQEVINPIFGSGKAVGGLDGHWGQVGNQLVGILIAWVFALVGTIVLLKIVDLLTGVRVPEEHEIEGLDITQHGEEAYNLES